MLSGVFLVIYWLVIHDFVFKCYSVSIFQKKLRFFCKEGIKGCTYRSVFYVFQHENIFFYLKVCIIYFFILILHLYYLSDKSD